MKFEVRQLDCYLYDEEWTQNTSYLIGKIETSAKDERRAFTRYLKREGLTETVIQLSIEKQRNHYLS